MEEIETDGVIWSLYKGIDFEKVYNHPTDGSGGMMICFISSYNDEQKAFEDLIDRNRKISSLLSEPSEDPIYKKHKRFTEVGSNYVIIYQCGLNEVAIINAIREKIVNNIFPSKRYSASTVRGAFAK